MGCRGAVYLIGWRKKNLFCKFWSRKNYKTFPQTSQGPKSEGPRRLSFTQSSSLHHRRKGYWWRNLFLWYLKTAQFSQGMKNMESWSWTRGKNSLSEAQCLILQGGLPCKTEGATGKQVRALGDTGGRGGGVWTPLLCCYTSQAPVSLIAILDDGSTDLISCYEELKNCCALSAPHCHWHLLCFL